MSITKEKFEHLGLVELSTVASFLREQSDKILRIRDKNKETDEMLEMYGAEFLDLAHKLDDQANRIIEVMEEEQAKHGEGYEKSEEDAA